MPVQLGVIREYSQQSGVSMYKAAVISTAPYISTHIFLLYFFFKCVRLQVPIIHLAARGEYLIYVAVRGEYLIHIAARREYLVQLAASIVAWGEYMQSTFIRQG
jgi:hypothetical protein